MADKIAFQFDDNLDFQKDAVSSVVELFKGLPKETQGIYENIRQLKKIGEGNPVRNPDIIEGSRLIYNIQNVQKKNNLFVDSEVKGNNFTIEMETGTGKTYVYLRTILELNKVYGFKKFMIVVPSIPIREGVKKSIEMLNSHFKALYDIDLSKHSFIYEGSNYKRINSDFVEPDELCICVFNIQSFNKDTNKIRTADEYGEILWEDMKYIRPIVIIDEPQKIEGTKRKKSASLKAIDELKPLFVLRYSATHKQLFNQIYKLDSFEAFKKNLVKKIIVKTVHGVIPKDYPYVRYVKFTKDLKAKIEIFSQKQGESIKFKTFDVLGNASLYDLSGELSQYKNMRIMEDPHKLLPLKIAYDDGIKQLEVGESTHEISKNDAVRIQIRLTIKNHFDKQFEILESGRKIKVISLFFVDKVSNVRDNNAPDGRGEYLKIFDEEYSKMINNSYYKNKFEKYKEFFKGYKDIQNVREGYFAIDKNKKPVDIEGWDSSLEDNKIKAKSEEDIDRGIELILEKKDELISFEEPLCFIFSHSALREGWDNPNVFTLCTLKNGGSEIAKKQEIGRGLRLPVDVSGKRCTDTNINELTVIANDYYENFAGNLQKDWNENMSFNKDEVTPDIIMLTLKNSGIPDEKVTPELENAFRNELIVQGIMSDKNLLTKNADEIKHIDFKDETLKEHSEMIKENFAKYMVEKGTRKIPVENGDNPPVKNGRQSFISEKEFMKLFSSLSDKLSQRSIYRYKLDRDEFIEKCSSDLNDYMRNMELKSRYELEYGKASFDDMHKFNMSDAKEKDIELFSDENDEEKSDFEIVNYIMYHTMLPRFAIFKILRRLEKRYLLNNQDILDLVTQRILRDLKNSKTRELSYEVIKGYAFDAGKIFEAEKIDSGLFNKEKAVFISDGRKHKAVNKYYHMDSKGEYDFAEALENNDNILLFTKLKRGGFVIDTPYGGYSPDWAIVYKDTDGGVILYFVAESKFEKNEENLTDVERLKIKCGIKHFEAVSDDVKFNWVNSYRDFKNKFGVKDSI